MLSTIIHCKQTTADLSNGYRSLSEMYKRFTVRNRDKNLLMVHVPGI